MQQGTSAISASISARYQSVTNSYRCNEYETQPPPRLATLSLSLSLPFPDPAMTYNLVYIYIYRWGRRVGEVESNRVHPLHPEYLILPPPLRLT